MSSQWSGPCRRAATIALCGLLLAVAIGVLAASQAQAARYKMLLCAGNNGSNSFDVATNTASAQNPNGIFSVENQATYRCSTCNGTGGFHHPMVGGDVCRECAGTGRLCANHGRNWS